MKPLRKIVETKLDPISSVLNPSLVEVLECGHEQRQKTDIYGPTNAYRRRCRQCPSIIGPEPQPEPADRIKAKIKKIGGVEAMRRIEQFCNKPAGDPIDPDCVCGHPLSLHEPAIEAWLSAWSEDVDQGREPSWAWRVVRAALENVERDHAVWDGAFASDGTQLCRCNHTWPCPRADEEYARLWRAISGEEARRGR